MAINIATGEVSLEFDDFEVPGRVPLRWNARYAVSNVDSVLSPIGRGWFGLAFCSLRRLEDGFVLTTATGAPEHFFDPEHLIERGGVVRNFGAYLEIFRDDERYVVRSWNVQTGEVGHLCFDVPAAAAGPSNLTAVEDVSGDGVDLIWQPIAGGSRLVAMRQRVERRELRFTYDRSGWMERVDLRGPDGSGQVVVKYEHDALGNLVRIADAADFSDRFEYDAQGRVTREIIKDGGVFRYKYDDFGRCVLHTGLAHYNERRLRYMQPVGITEVTDSYGSSTTYTYLPSGQVVLENDAVGGKRVKEYDEYGRVVTNTDATGATTRFVYDEQGNRAMVVDVLGRRTRVSFNERHQPVEMIDAGGHRWRRAYDARGRLLGVEDPLGGRWIYGYDGDGNIVELRNPLGDARRMAYQNGVLASITDWMGQQTRYQSDVFGRVVERYTPKNERTRVRYDAVGNPVQVQQADGSSTLASYDHAGNLIRHIDANGRETRWRYGPCGRLLERIDASGNTLRYIWGTEPDRLEQVVNEKGETHTYEFDPVGRIVAETTFAGARRQYRLDAEGRTIAYVSANDETLAIERDAVGRIVGQRLPDGEELHFSYDALGELIEAVNGDIDLSYERDALGRVVREIQGDRWVKSIYDGAGGLLRVETSAGHLVDYQVDANSQPIVWRVRGHTLHFELDANGLEVGRRLPGGLKLEQQYDTVGRLTAQQLSFVDLDSRRGMQAIVRRQYGYDKVASLMRSADAIWGRADFTYDPVDRLLASLRARGPSEQFSYDRTGNITHLQSEGPQLRDEVFSYGPGDRLLMRNDTLFEYDAEGRCTRRIEDARGATPKEWVYQWTALDRLKSVKRPDGTVWRYRYDALARRIEKTCDDVPVCEYLWDRDVVAQELLPDGERRTWLWEPDSFAPVATIQREQFYTVVNDHLGTPRELIDEKGVVARAQMLDSWGRLAEVHQSPSGPICDVRFQGQWADPESGLHYNFFRYFDPGTARYMSEDPLGLLGGNNAFAYVPNPSRWVDPLGLCNGNSSRARRAQHGYNILDMSKDPPVIVKTGVSGRPLNQNGSSPRANNQVNRWNGEPGNATAGPNETPRYVAVVAKKVPPGPNSRPKILAWEQRNADANRATLDPDRHKRP